MDHIERLLHEIQNDRRIRVLPSRRFAEEVGRIYEKYGYGLTKAFLQAKLHEEKGRSQDEIRSLLLVIDKVKSYNLPSSIGGYIIRKLPFIVRR